MVESILFYKYQILMGSVLGAITALFGVFVLLQRRTFFGLTLAQAAVFSVALSLMLEWHSESFILFITALIMLPFFSGRRSPVAGSDSMLAAGFVFFTAMAQILLSLGGNVQNNLMVAYFGNIIMMDPGEWRHLIPLLASILVLLMLFYRRFLSVFFDRDHAQLTGIRVGLMEFLFYLMLTAVTGTTINMMGSFYTVAHMVIPGIVALQFARSMKGAFLMAILISLASTIVGFAASLAPIPIAGQELQLPTSSTIIFVLAAWLLLLALPQRGGAGRSS